MLLKNSPEHYGQVARILHWTSVGLLLTTVYLSSVFDDLDNGTERDALIAQHISYGLVLLLIMLARFSWRQANLNPIHSYSIHAWQKRMAISVHWLIYAVVIFQCLIGIAQVMSNGTGLYLFDVMLLGGLTEKNVELNERLNDVHLAIANLIYIVLSVHILAAIYHQIFGVLESESDD